MSLTDGGSQLILCWDFQPRLDITKGIKLKTARKGLFISSQCHSTAWDRFSFFLISISLLLFRALKKRVKTEDVRLYGGPNMIIKIYLSWKNKSFVSKTDLWTIHVWSLCIGGSRTCYTPYWPLGQQPFLSHSLLAEKRAIINVPDLHK